MKDLEIGVLIFDNKGRLWKVTNSFFNAIYEIVEVYPVSFKKAKVRYIHSFELMTQFTVR